MCKGSATPALGEVRLQVLAGHVCQAISSTGSDRNRRQSTEYSSTCRRHRHIKTITATSENSQLCRCCRSLRSPQLCERDPPRLHVWLSPDAASAIAIDKTEKGHTLFYPSTMTRGSETEWQSAGTLDTPVLHMTGSDSVGPAVRVFAVAAEHQPVDIELQGTTIY